MDYSVQDTNIAHMHQFEAFIHVLIFTIPPVVYYIVTKLIPPRRLCMTLLSDILFLVITSYQIRV